MDTVASCRWAYVVCQVLHRPVNLQGLTVFMEDLEVVPLTIITFKPRKWSLPCSQHLEILPLKYARRLRVAGGISCNREAIR